MADLVHYYTILCDYAFKDADGKLHCMGMYQNIQMQALPGTVPQTFVIVGLHAEGLAGRTLDLAIGAVEGDWEEPIARAEFPDDFGPEPGAPGTTTILSVTLVGFRFPRAGAYEVRVKEGDEIHHALVFGVKKGS